MRSGRPARSSTRRARKAGKAPASRPTKQYVESQADASDKRREADTADDHHVLRLARDEDPVGDILRVDADLDGPAHGKGSNQRPGRLLGLAEAYALRVARRCAPLATSRVRADQLDSVGGAFTMETLIYPG